MAKELEYEVEVYKFTFDLAGDGYDATTFHIVARTFAGAVEAAQQVIALSFPGQKLIEVSRVGVTIFFADDVGYLSQI